VQILVVTVYHTVEGEHLNCFIGGLENRLFLIKKMKQSFTLTERKHYKNYIILTIDIYIILLMFILLIQ
jgi:hypothetical protein